MLESEPIPPRVNGFVLELLFLVIVSTTATLNERIGHTQRIHLETLTHSQTHQTASDSRVFLVFFLILHHSFLCFANLIC